MPTHNLKWDFNPEISYSELVTESRNHPPSPKHLRPTHTLRPILIKAIHRLIPQLRITRIRRLWEQQQ